MIDIKTEKESDILRIDVNGEIDASSSIHLDNAIEKAFSEGENKILINLEKLDYISSAGLGVFISRLEEMKEKNIGMVLYGLNQGVFEVFEILGLEKLLRIEKDKETAINAINEA